MAIAGHEIGQALCDALNLPKQTRSFVLRVETGRIVTVECEYFPEDGDGITSALAEYELVRKPEPVMQPTAMHFDTWMRLRTEAAHAAMMARMKALSARDAVEAQALQLKSLKQFSLALRGML
jgi:hypothetical protein